MEQWGIAHDPLENPLVPRTVRDRLEEKLDAIRNQSTPVFLKTYDEQARASADAADLRRAHGMTHSPLDGVIVSVKDLFDVQGDVTTAGSIILKDQPPATQNAPVVQRLLQAGAVIIGRTNMSEFAFSGVGINPHYGTPGNAADKSRVPGGSSSGAGVSATEGTSQIAIGTDTGGSIRIPAALNGCVGFKPSAQRVPKAGAFPLSWMLDSVGPLAKSVADCFAADSVLAGRPFEKLIGADLGAVTLGLPDGPLQSIIAPDVHAAFEKARDRLARAGVRFVTFPYADLVERLDRMQGTMPLAAIEAAAVHASFLDGRKGDYDPRVHARISGGRQATAVEYILKARERAALIAEFNQRMENIDALFTPSTAITAPTIAETNASDEAFFATNGKLLRITMLGNLLDTCGVSLPAPDITGMPVGLLLSAVNGQDIRLLKIAAAVEKALQG